MIYPTALVTGGSRSIGKAIVQQLLSKVTMLPLIISAVKLVQ